ncbi:MAG: HAD-IA family hydrolase [Alphaproteobacteria bacterium]|nr:HAD-IA family hydrolase [Alphaproteobacteria bacterium]
MSKDRLSKIVVWDADGVIFRTFNDRGEFIWSATLMQDLGIALDVIEDIFSDQWQDVIRGKRDTRQHMQNVFDRRRVKVSVDDFLSYWLTKCDTIDNEVASLLGNYESYIATNQDPIRAAHFQDVFPESVRKVYASSAIGALKPNQAFYRHIEQDLKISPHEIWFIDDVLENVEAAKSRGWRAHQFVDVLSLRSFLEAE